MFRLALINPNTAARHTEAMRDVAAATLPGGCDVTAVSPERGPTSIESEADAVVAASEVVAPVGGLPEPDAHLVACFGDPGAGAEALVLACGGMADVADTVQREIGVPVCDGVAFGAMTAFALWRCGLRTSKVGAYAWPERIAYAGMPGFRSRRACGDLPRVRR